MNLHRGKNGSMGKEGGAMPMPEKASCFHIRPAAMRNRSLKKCVLGFFFLDFLLGWFCSCFLSQHMKSDLRLQIKNSLFLESIKPLQQALYL